MSTTSKPSCRRRSLAAIAASAALSLATTLAAPAASADPSEGTFTRADRAYLADLTEQRGSIDGTPRQLVELGVATCGALRTNPVQSVVDTGIRAGISGWDTGVLVSAASRNYCPDTWPAVRTWAEAV